MTHGAAKPASVEALKAPPAVEHKITKGGAFRVPAPPSLPVEQGEGIKYLAGTRLDCPIQNVHVSGICFHRFTGGKPVFEETGKGAGQPGIHVNDARKLGAARWGGYVMLTDAQLEALAQDVGRKMLRRDGGRSKVVATKAPSFKSRPDDQPLGKFIYLVRADALNGEHMETGDYPPMIAE